MIHYICEICNCEVINQTCYERVFVKGKGGYCVCEHCLGAYRKCKKVIETEVEELEKRLYSTVLDTIRASKKDDGCCG